MELPSVFLDVDLPFLTGEGRPSLEDSLVIALAQVRELAHAHSRELAEKAGDDGVRRWTAQALDRRPVYFMGVADEGSLHLWMMDPPKPGVSHPPSWMVVHAHVSHLMHDDGTRRDLADAEAISETKAHTEAAQALGWLYRDIHGEFPKPAPDEG